MIRILHLTDFHLNNRTLKDWNDFYKSAFLKKLGEINLEKKIDIVAFTGDLIDKGGKDFGSARIAFENFRENIINPIIHALGLPVENFMICPGNHDIVRAADDKIDENGLTATLVSEEEVIDFIEKADASTSYRRIERIKDYKNFELEIYQDIECEKLHSIFKFSIKLRIGNTVIGLSSLNSSWRCYDDNDFGNILIGENQLNDNFKFIEDCDVKIALVHHQLDWLCGFEQKTISSHINKNYDLVLSGHVHEQMSRMTTTFVGSCFHNISPSGLNQIRTDSKTFSNGFTIIDYNNSINCYYLKYNHQNKEFVDNTDIAPNGKINYAKPKTETENDLSTYREAISNIIEDHYPEMNNHFIKGKNDTVDITVRSAFVYPPIDDGKNFYQQEQSTIFLNEIVNLENHSLFLGPQECGKRSLLYRLIVEYVDEFEIYRKIPVFIDFYEVKNRDFITIIKEYTRLSGEKVRKLLADGKFIILIDNLDYHESKNLANQINKLHKFIKDYPKIRIIGGYEHDNIEILPSEIIGYCKIPFGYFYIRGLKTKEIKEVMQRWNSSNDVIENEENLDKLIKTFTSYHLPNNVLSVHLYLWSVENSDRKPINQAVLMEIYTELILEKLNKENIYRSNFDFTNKVQLISMVAEHVVKSEQQTLTYRRFFEIISEYIVEKVGFTFDVNVIINYLFDRKIFIKTSTGEVKFTYLCFMHFFVAKRMQDNPAFKSFILDKTRYFKYPKEIDYYTGLVRSDRDTFMIIFERFKELFDPMSFIIENVNPDEYFDISESEIAKESISQPIARNIEIAKIKDSRPSDEVIEKQYDEQLEKISTQSERVNSSSINFDRMLLIMCNVLRNSEGIEDLELKNEAYEHIIKHNITYSILYTQVVIRYLIENNRLPTSIPENVSLEYILKNIPYHIQESLFTHLGTKKLSGVVSTKIRKDAKNSLKTTSEIERFLSVALYSDIQGPDFDTQLRKFVKAANTVPTQNYLLFKLTHYLYKRSKSGTVNEDLYLDLLSDLKIRTQKLPKRLKEKIIKELKEKKKKASRFLLLE